MSAFDSAHVGPLSSQAERLVRRAPCAIWVVVSQCAGQGTEGLCEAERELRYTCQSYRFHAWRCVAVYRPWRPRPSRAKTSAKYRLPCGNLAAQRANHVPPSARISCAQSNSSSANARWRASRTRRPTPGDWPRQCSLRVRGGTLQVAAQHERVVRHTGEDAARSSRADAAARSSSRSPWAISPAARRVPGPIPASRTAIRTRGRRRRECPSPAPRSLRPGIVEFRLDGGPNASCSPRRASRGRRCQRIARSARRGAPPTASASPDWSSCSRAYCRIVSSIL